MQTQAAINDIAQGLGAWRFWTMLGWNDVKQRYRRTLLGPLWITGSMAVMIGGLGIIYSSIFKTDVSSYILYLTAGMVNWFFISSCLIESSTAFIASEGIIKQSPLPFTLYIWRLIWRNFIVFLHNSVVFFALLLFLGNFELYYIALIVIGLVLAFLNIFLIALLLAILSTRFRDLPPIITSLMQVLFYVTPVIYAPNQLNPRLETIAKFNPVFHLIEVIRRPMLGELPPFSSYVAIVLMLFVIGIVTFLVFRRFRSRIAYWL